MIRIGANNRRHSQAYKLATVSGVLVLACLALLIGVRMVGAVPAVFGNWDLSDTSPNPNSMVNTKTDEGGALHHIIKNMKTTHIYSTELVVYDQNDKKATDAERYLRISNESCVVAQSIINARSDEFKNGTTYMKVTLEGYDTKDDTGNITKTDTLTYHIRITEVCNTNPDRINVAGKADGSGWRNNSLAGRYPMPRPKARDASGRYRTVVTIELAEKVCAPGEGANDCTSDKDESADQRMVFDVRAPGAIGAGDRTVGLKTTGNAKQFGIVGTGPNGNAGGASPADKKAAYGVKFGIPFGLRCGEAGPLEKEVTLFDVDNEIFGPSKLWVLRKSRVDGNVERLDRASYYYLSSDITSEQKDKRDADRKVVWRFNDGNGYYESNVVGDGKQVSIGVRIETGYNYFLVVENPLKTTTQNTPNQNVFSLSIPTDTVFGQINCSYDLTPAVDVSPGVYSHYPKLEVGSGVSNSTAGVTGSHEWQVWRLKYAQGPDPVLPEDKRHNAFPDPCSIIQSATGRASSSCDMYHSNTTSNFPASRTDTYTSLAPDPPGTRTCFVTRVKDPTDAAGDNNQWYYSELDCALSSKSPKVHILGTDLKVGGDITTSRTETKVPVGDEMRWFGSWVEYSVFSTGINKVASSGSGLRSGNVDSLPAVWSKLTYANTITPTTPDYGGYGNLVLPNARSWFAGLTAPSGNTLSGADQSLPSESGVYKYNGAGTIKINESTLAGTGKSVIIQAPNGTVELTGTGITVPNDGRTKVNEISQVVIVAKNIRIDHTVKKIDAWLLAREEINTCGDEASNPATILLTSGICNVPLEVNGAVSAKTLYLMRTANADANNPEAAAETFNLRPDAQLWAYNYANGGDRAQTTYLKELPPRF